MPALQKRDDRSVYQVDSHFANAIPDRDYVRAESDREARRWSADRHPTATHRTVEEIEEDDVPPLRTVFDA
jgi:hypothetical protein